MKKIFPAFAFLVLLASFSETIYAQQAAPEVCRRTIPRWVSAAGYWVSESNINNPKHIVICFYNNNNVIVYKETMNGLVLNLDKRRTKMRLKKLVDRTVAAYVQNKKAAENQMLVVNMIKR